MLKLFFILLMFFSFPVSEASARGSSRTCPAQTRPPKIKITPDYGKPRYFFNRTRDEIEGFATKQRKISGKGSKRARSLASRKGGKPHIPGITATRFEISMSANAAVASNPYQKGLCVYLDGVDIGIKYINMDVYVAKRYPEGSCQRQVILDHEKTHVGIFHSTLKFYTPYFAKAAKEAVSKIKPVWVPSNDRANEALSNMLNYVAKKVEPTINFFQKVQAKEHAKLDTPENYAYTSSLCKSW